MPGCHVITILILVTMVFSEVVEGPEPILQRTIAELFTWSPESHNTSDFGLINMSRRQATMCRKDPGLVAAIANARDQARHYCSESFYYDRWNCTVLLNNKTKRSIFKHVYRETAFVHALVAASVTHSIARACAAGTLDRCACTQGRDGNLTSSSWKYSGCNDDFKYARKTVKSFLNLKAAGNDPVAGVLKQNIGVGITTVGTQMRESCKCHGFSGSCSLKTCWKRVAPFNSTVALLKKQYHHAVRKKVANYASKRAAPDVKHNHMRRKKGRKLPEPLVYLQKSPNLCSSTRGRRCRDPGNCATLCCGRGYRTRTLPRTERCRCRWIDCCYVDCDECTIEDIIYICK